ncbi:hypothetical protein AB6A40_005078 [Gnathostoma spinigerum]|uniref:Uncharacterized protein n=1 Tax=Gnathostoma spinigerum TaxID=75299 RepID=A0ABD6EJP3_9BILA
MRLPSFSRTAENICKKPISISSDNSAGIFGEVKDSSVNDAGNRSAYPVISDEVSPTSASDSFPEDVPSSSKQDTVGSHETNATAQPNYDGHTACETQKLHGVDELRFSTDSSSSSLNKSLMKSPCNDMQMSRSGDAEVGEVSKTEMCLSKSFKGTEQNRLVEFVLAETCFDCASITVLPSHLKVSSTNSITEGTPNKKHRISKESIFDLETMGDLPDSEGYMVASNYRSSKIRCSEVCIPCVKLTDEIVSDVEGLKSDSSSRQPASSSENSGFMVNMENAKKTIISSAPQDKSKSDVIVADGTQESTVFERLEEASSIKSSDASGIDLGSSNEKSLLNDRFVNEENKTSTNEDIFKEVISKATNSYDVSRSSECLAYSEHSDTAPESSTNGFLDLDDDESELVIVVDECVTSEDKEPTSSFKKTESDDQARKLDSSKPPSNVNRTSCSIAEGDFIGLKDNARDDFIAASSNLRQSDGVSESVSLDRIKELEGIAANVTSPKPHSDGEAINCIPLNVALKRTDSNINVEGESQRSSQTVSNSEPQCHSSVVLDHHGLEIDDDSDGGGPTVSNITLSANDVDELMSEVEATRSPLDLPSHQRRTEDVSSKALVSELDRKRSGMAVLTKTKQICSQSNHSDDSDRLGKSKERNKEQGIKRPMVLKSEISKIKRGFQAVERRGIGNSSRQLVSMINPKTEKTAESNTKSCTSVPCPLLESCVGKLGPDEGTAVFLKKTGVNQSSLVPQAPEVSQSNNKKSVPVCSLSSVGDGVAGAPISKSSFNVLRSPAISPAGGGKLETSIIKSKAILMKQAKNRMSLCRQRAGMASKALVGKSSLSSSTTSRPAEVDVKQSDSETRKRSARMAVLVNTPTIALHSAKRRKEKSQLQAPGETSLKAGIEERRLISLFENALGYHASQKKQTLLESVEQFLVPEVACTECEMLANVAVKVLNQMECGNMWMGIIKKRCCTEMPLSLLERAFFDLLNQLSGEDKWKDIIKLFLKKLVKSFSSTRTSSVTRHGRDVRCMFMAANILINDGEDVSSWIRDVVRNSVEYHPSDWVVPMLCYGVVIIPDVMKTLLLGSDESELFMRTLISIHTSNNEELYTVFKRFMLANLLCCTSEPVLQQIDAKKAKELSVTFLNAVLETPNAFDSTLLMMNSDFARRVSQCVTVYSVMSLRLCPEKIATLFTLLTDNIHELLLSCGLDKSSDYKTSTCTIFLDPASKERELHRTINTLLLCSRLICRLDTNGQLDRTLLGHVGNISEELHRIREYLERDDSEQSCPLSSDSKANILIAVKDWNSVMSPYSAYFSKEYCTEVINTL